MDLAIAASYNRQQKQSEHEQKTTGLYGTPSSVQAYSQIRVMAFQHSEQPNHSSAAYLRVTLGLAVHLSHWCVIKHNDVTRLYVWTDNTDTYSKPPVWYVQKQYARRVEQSLCIIAQPIVNPFFLFCFWKQQLQRGKRRRSDLKPICIQIGIEKDRINYASSPSSCERIMGKLKCVSRVHNRLINLLRMTVVFNVTDTISMTFGNSVMVVSVYFRIY